MHVYGNMTFSWKWFFEQLIDCCIRSAHKPFTQQNMLIPICISALIFKAHREEVIYYLFWQFGVQLIELMLFSEDIYLFFANTRACVLDSSITSFRKSIIFCRPFESASFVLSPPSVFCNSLIYVSFHLVKKPLYYRCFPVCLLSRCLKRTLKYSC